MLAEVGGAALLIADFVVGEDGVVEGGAGLEEMINDAGEFVGGGGNGLGGAEPGAHAAKVVAEGGVALAGAVGGHAQGVGGAALHGAGVGREHFAAGDAVIGTKAEPGGKMFRRGKLREIAANFCKEGVNVDGAQTRQGGEVDAEDAVQVAAQIELGLAALGFFALAADGGRRRIGGLAREGGEVLFDLAVARQHLRLIMPVDRQRLLEGEEVLAAVAKS